MKTQNKEQGQQLKHKNYEEKHCSSPSDPQPKQAHESPAASLSFQWDHAPIRIRIRDYISEPWSGHFSTSHKKEINEFFELKATPTQRTETFTTWSGSTPVGHRRSRHEFDRCCLGQT